MCQKNTAEHLAWENHSQCPRYNWLFGQNGSSSPLPANVQIFKCESTYLCMSTCHSKRKTCTLVPIKLLILELGIASTYIGHAATQSICLTNMHAFFVSKYYARTLCIHASEYTIQIDTSDMTYDA